MGTHTRQVRAVYRESTTFRVDRHGTRQLLSAFFFTAGASAALLAGATRFSHHTAMQDWLRWAAMLVLMLGCIGIGFKLISISFGEIRGTATRSVESFMVPQHFRPKRRDMVLRFIIGILLGVVVPIGLIAAQFG